ncbi:MAG: hypothetical protein ACREN8_07940 [Candidatus Dormibacteraceae bacterium]
MSVTGVPNSAATVLAKGKAVTATIKLVNSGTVKKNFFADSRLGQRSRLNLEGNRTSNVSLPLSTTSVPSFSVPPGTDQVVFSAVGSVPIIMDVFAAHNDPDRLGPPQANNTAVATVIDPEVADGRWFVLPTAVGPFPGSGVGKATVDVTATADTYPFDSAISATSGDVWAQTVNSSASSTPLSLDPGASGAITLTITPGATRGEVVRGFTGVDTYNENTGSGDEVGLIPYTYKLG